MNFINKTIEFQTKTIEYLNNKNNFHLITISKQFQKIEQPWS